MAPYLPISEIIDLEISSLELETRSVSEVSAALESSPFKRDEYTSFSFSPSTEISHKITARDIPLATTGVPNHGGAINPNDINMKGVQAIFALIGVTFVLGSIWFFFWAKNGGFQWRKGDWDDYKSTVMRRKGPNGTTLSNATKSTRLGGGSVVGKGYSDAESGSTVSESITMTETMTELSSEAPIMREKRARKETAKERRVREVQNAGWEGGHDDDMRAYRHEKPARVGGINKDSDALHYGTDYTDTTPSVSSNHRTSRQPQPQQPRQSSSRHASPEKRQSRRDFSYGQDIAFTASIVSSNSTSQPPHQNYDPTAPAPPPRRPGRYHSPSKQPTSTPAADTTHRRSAQYPSTAAAGGATGAGSRPTTQNIPGAYNSTYHNYNGSGSDIQSQNTKSYHHPLPMAPAGNGAARGYRRDRRDSLE